MKEDLESEVEEIIQELENSDFGEGVRYLRRQKLLSKIAGWTMGSCMFAFSLKKSLPILKALMDPSRRPEFLEFLTENPQHAYNILSEHGHDLLVSIAGGILFYQLLWGIRKITSGFKTFGMLGKDIRSIPALFEGDIEKAHINELRKARLSKDPFERKRILASYYFYNGRIDACFTVLKESCDLIKKRKFKPPLFDYFLIPTNYFLGSLALSLNPRIRREKTNFVVLNVDSALSSLEVGKIDWFTKRLDRAISIEPEEVGLRFIQAYGLDVFGEEEKANEKYNEFLEELVLFKAFKGF